MKVKVKTEQRAVGDLLYGTTFFRDDKYYIVTDETDCEGQKVLCVELESGVISRIWKDDFVIPVPLVVTIESEDTNE